MLDLFLTPVLQRNLSLEREISYICIYTQYIYIYIHTHIQSFMVNGFSPLFSKIELGKRLGVGGGQVHDEKIT